MMLINVLYFENNGTYYIFKNRANKILLATVNLFFMYYKEDHYMREEDHYNVLTYDFYKLYKINITIL